ncbi:MAG: hypothetical protein WC006_06595 [Bacilli bacterium]
MWQECANNWKQEVDDIKKYKIDEFAIGYDWGGELDNLSKICEVRSLPRTKYFSSTKIKNLLYGIPTTHLNQIKYAFIIDT